MTQDTALPYNTVMAGTTSHGTTISKTRPLGRNPVSIPDGIEDRSRPRASGLVQLPHHIAWSPPYTFNFDDPEQLCWAYARVITEGLPDDVLRYINLDTLISIWDEIHLPAHVRAVWHKWLTKHGYLPPSHGSN